MIYPFHGHTPRTPIRWKLITEGLYPYMLRWLGILTSDDVFRLHPKIRWAALSRKPDMVEFSQMRPGVVSHTSDAEDRAFMEMGPLFITSIAERLTPGGKAGELQCVIACFEKDCVLMTKAGEGYLALSVERDEALMVFQEIIPQILKLASHFAS